MKRTKLCTGIAVLVTFGGGFGAVAIAQGTTPSEPAPRVMERKIDVQNAGDKPGRGGLRGGAMLLEHFDEIDTNKDGLLSRDEIIAWHKTHRPPEHVCRQMIVFKKGDGKGKGEGMPPFARMSITDLDKNGDGVITLDEFLEPHKRMFEHLDTNHDGKLSPDEMPKPFMRRGPDGEGGPCPPPPGDMPPPLPPAQ